MNLLMATGFVLTIGYLMGEVATLIKLPKVSGYIIAGILLNPGIIHILPKDYITNTTPLIHISLAFITFSIGGSLSYSKIRSSGKVILLTTLFESLFAYIMVSIFVFATTYLVFDLFNSWSVSLAISLVLASVASPTDPSATLALTNEYHAKGKVSSTILGIAAFDDITGIIFYTLTITFAKFLLHTGDNSFVNSLVTLGREIGGALLLGLIYGGIFNYIIHKFKKIREGEMIVIILAMLLFCYGSAQFFKFDELLSTMALGVVVVNYNKHKRLVFGIIERYTDELIFVIFFTLSCLHLNLSALSGSVFLIAVFVISRALGKLFGTQIATSMVGADLRVRKYTAGGLLPQGGIVVGLALLVAKDEAFKDYGTLIIGVVIGATVIHELIGPIVAKYSLKKAGEIK